MIKEFKVTKDSDEKPAEKIPIHYLRDRETGDINRVRLSYFVPGMIIERAGRKYQVDAKGTQRLVK